VFECFGQLAYWSFNWSLHQIINIWKIPLFSLSVSIQKIPQESWDQDWDDNKREEWLSCLLSVMRWQDKSNKDRDNWEHDAKLANSSDNADHPVSVSCQETVSPVIGIVLPNLNSILLEVILYTPAFTLGLCLIISKSSANCLPVSWESLLNVHSQEKSKWVLVIVEKSLTNMIL